MPDLRWGRCDIKSLNLLPNVLAKQQAFEAGAFEAIFIRSGPLTEGTRSRVTEGPGSYITEGTEGTGSHVSDATSSYVTEGTSSNVFAVFGDALVTPPPGQTILSGVTREMVLEIAKSEGLKAEERAIPGLDLLRADEVFSRALRWRFYP